MSKISIQLAKGAVNNVSCTEVQIEILLDGTVQITVFEKGKIISEYIVRPSIVIFGNAAIPILNTTEIVEEDLQR